MNSANLILLQAHTRKAYNPCSVTQRTRSVPDVVMALPATPAFTRGVKVRTAALYSEGKGNRQKIAPSRIPTAIQCHKFFAFSQLPSTTALCVGK